MRPLLNGGTLGGRMATSGDPEGVHVETDCCTSCGVPWHYAPEVFREGASSCEVVRQPRNATELRRVLTVFRAQDLNCVRYGGSDARIIALLERVGCATNLGPYLPSPPVVVPSRVTPPTGLRSVLAVVAMTSAITLVAGLSALPSGNFVVSLGCLIGASGIVLSWAAWTRRRWGFLGIILLAVVVSLVAVAAGLAGHRVSMLGPLLFISAAFALFSMRRWYAPPAP
jgi:hypothetical protein